MTMRCTTDRQAAQARAARDQLRDLFELLGIGVRVDLDGDGDGRLVVRIAGLPFGESANLADALLAGARSRQVLLPEGAPLYSLRHGGVGVVTGVTGERVTLRSLADGAHWCAGSGQLRAATLAEIGSGGRCDGDGDDGDAGDAL